MVPPQTSDSKSTGQPEEKHELKLQIRANLADSEANFRLLANQAPVGIFQTDAQGNCIFVNSKWLELAGLNPDQAMGQGWFQALHPDDRAVVLQKWLATVQSGQEFSGEYRFRSLQGQVYWVVGKAVAIRDPAGTITGYLGTVTDITERKHAETMLVELNQTLEYVVEGISRLDLQGRYLSVNKVYAQITGYEPGELLGQNWQCTVHPQDLERVQAVYQLMLQTGKVEIEATGLRKDGSTFEKLLIMIAAYDDLGQVSGHYCLMKDITERKRMEAERQQVETTLRQQARQRQLGMEIAQRIRQSLNLEQILATTVSDVRQFLQTDRVLVFEIAADGTGTVVAESVAPEWISIQSTTIFDPCFAEQYVEPFRQGLVVRHSDITTEPLEPCYRDLLTPYQVRANLTVPILQGENLWGLLIAHECAGPRQWQAAEVELLQQLALQVGIAVQQAELYQQAQAELQERQRAEAKIREQAALLDIAGDAILVRDLQHTIQFWNHGAERIFGWTAAEALGQNANRLLYKELTPQLAEALHVVMDASEWQGELVKVTKSGKEITVASRWSLVRDAQGQPKSILTVDTDITEKKQLETQFLRTQRLESIGTLAGGIAHDLNNLLTPVLITAQLLQKPLPPKQTQELLEILEANARRGADLVRQVLTFARGSEGKRVPLQLKHLLQEIRQIAHHTFSKAINIQLDTPQDLWLVSADITQLHQVLMNLCVNARDAMPMGGTLRLRAENFQVDATYAQMHLGTQVGPYVVLSVSDTGTGIAPEVRERIFDPFFSTKAVGQGTGLGLSVVEGIVRSHGGVISVESQPGQGTEFKIYLPAIQLPTVLPTPSSDLPRGKGELVLVVDDEAHLRQITQTLLEEYGYHVLAASNGIEAIACYAQQPTEIQIVIMDLAMPEMNGVVAIQTLAKINSQVRVIASSGLSTEQQLLAGMQLGVVKAYLPKPYTAGELLHTLQAVLAVPEG